MRTRISRKAEDRSRTMATRTKPAARRKTTVAAPKPKTATPAAPVKAQSEPPAVMPTGSAAPDADRTERVRRGDLLDAMAERSPMRRADLKVVMELMLEEMGKLLDNGDEVVLPPLGKLMVKKRVPRDGGDILTVKLKRQPSDAT
jgi:nucleoid DNA-binding protein